MMERKTERRIKGWGEIQDDDLYDGEKDRKTNKGME